MYIIPEIMGHQVDLMGCQVVEITAPGNGGIQSPIDFRFCDNPRILGLQYLNIHKANISQDLLVQKFLDL